jgi:hypothetical protein
MTTLSQQILDLLKLHPGLTDREITDSLRGKSAPQQPINSTARSMAEKGLLQRSKRLDGKIGNYLTSNPPQLPRIMPPPLPGQQSGGLQEDDIKKALEAWLYRLGWHTTIAWGKELGADIIATQGSSRWIIEVKGIGSLNAMRVNYILGILGEILQRMDDPDAKYSIALPDISQFRNLWEKLPLLTKQRTGISALFIDAQGEVKED